MFGSRRRRAASNPYQPPSNASASAATAAAQAFLSSQTSNAALSSAAAAAALKARPTTPTSVADVQTKRTLRRAGSTSSVASSATGSAGGRPSLERRASSASMSERTFRESSPSRLQPVPSAPDAPPVPAIPKHIKTDVLTKTPRRAASIDAPMVRVASPPPHPASGRGASLGPPATTQPPRRAGHRVSNSLELSGSERRGANPPTIYSPHNPSLVYDPNTRSFLPASELWAIEQRVQGAASKPVKKMKKVAPKESTGTHLADGTIGGRPRGTAIDTVESTPKETAPTETGQLAKAPPAAIPGTTAPPRARKKKAVISDAGSNASDAESESSLPSYAGVSSRRSPPLQKRPSVVHEDREREEAENETPRHRLQQARVDELPPPVAVPEHLPAPVSEPVPTSVPTAVPVPIQALEPVPPPGPETMPPSIPAPGAAPTAMSRDSTLVQAPDQTAHVEPPKLAIDTTPAHHQDKNAGMGAVAPKQASTTAARVHSVSPPRTHFAKTPESLLIVHSPPPRSVSPRKSAMKNSNSPRTMSPAGEGSDRGRNSSHERSPASIHVSSGMDSDEQQIQRKKSVRVSFDESSNIVLGAAGPVAAPESPTSDASQSRRSWFGFPRRKGKDMPSLDDDDEEVMKPRPALPSFGSIRSKKHQDTSVVEDRPLVKPPPPVMDSAGGTPPMSTEHSNNSKDSLDEILGQSSDHAIGGIMAQDFASNEQTKERNPLDPLPPQVTTVEGSGYVSDDGSSIVSTEDRSHEQEAPGFGAPQNLVGPDVDRVNRTEEARKVLSPVLEEPPLTPPASSNGNIPEINVQQASPTMEDLSKGSLAVPLVVDGPVKEHVHIPGQWDDDDVVEVPSRSAPPIQVTEALSTAGSTPATAGIAEPPVEQESPSVPISGIHNDNLYTHNAAAADETEESDGNSIYSDAAEDLSEFEGDGFISLDAVVESTVEVNSPIPGLAITTPPDSPAIRLRATSPQSMPVEASHSAGPGWDKAQQYWSSVNSGKKKELEMQTQPPVEDDASEEEEEEELKPVPTQKKKTATRATPTAKQPQKERSYMIQPGSKAAPEGYTPVMRTSMRGEAQGPVEAHMRSTMRSGGAIRSSMRSPPPQVQQSNAKNTTVQKSRPMSYPGPGSELASSAAAASSQVNKAAANNATGPSAPSLRRRGSADSDSSFKRARPTGSRSSILSFGKSGGRSGTKPKFGSTRNFDDSSDEEDSRPRAFSSRFVDSSDEEDDGPPPPPVSMTKSMRGTPLKTIPQRSGVEDGDSSDLPDSDDEKVSRSAGPLKLAKTRQTNGTTAPTKQGNALASGSLRRSGSGRETMGATTIPITTGTRPGKGGFMSILRRKKPDPGSKIHKSDLESAARRDTPLERSKSDLAMLRQGGDGTGAPGGIRVHSPKLQKRHTSDSWPLSNEMPVQKPPVGAEPARPNTSGVDGVDGTLTNGTNGTTNGTTNVMGERPALAGRRFTSNGLLVESELANNFSPGRKKKKFPALRRMFRLDD
ncbi:hypothetical protein DH86_00002889 [Scytalidium sp. 3C]|nr:hypothetical protein DH86_00002889 [Scytalidium sp. 3C]